MIEVSALILTACSMYSLQPVAWACKFRVLVNTWLKKAGYP